MEGLGHLRGIVADARGALLVADRKGGRLLRISPDGKVAIVLEDLKHPVGLALVGEARLVMVESGRRRVLRLEPSGEIMTLASGLGHPRWITAVPEGGLYVSAKSLWFEGDDGEDDEVESEVIVQVPPEGAVRVFADGFRGLQGLEVRDDTLSVAARGRKNERHPVGALYEIPILPDGGAGRVQTLVMEQFVHPTGLAADGLGIRFVTAKSLAGEPWQRDVIVKVGPSGAVTLFAEGLEDPRALAFGPDGSLYLADGDSGRILRFVAPRPPSLAEVPPVLTKQPQVALRLRAEAGSRVTVLGGQVPVVATVDASGSALITVPLRPDVENRLLVFVTGAAGLGLTSAPLAASIVHDDEPPLVELLTPRAGTLVRGTIAAEARATDVNGIADVEFRLDEMAVGIDTVQPFRISVDTSVVADGARVLTALARDRAGNVARATAQVTVDNTPPAVRIVAPAPGAVATGTVEAVVEAVDVTSGVARVELAVNGVSRFTVQTPPYRFQFEPGGTGPGPYLLVATATDRAGNRGQSAPVSITFSTVTVRISEPLEGAQVPAGLLLVRGRVESGGAEVGVAVNGVPAAVQGTTFAALVPVAPETTSLTAVATTSSGATSSPSVPIRVSSSAVRAIDLLATPSSGVAPLTVAFSLRGAPGGRVTLDFDGDGTMDFTGPSLEGQTFTYTQPGLYFPTAVITDAGGTPSRVTTAVNVLARDQMDALLKAKWNVMKAALTRNDIEGALLHFTPEQQPRFRVLFTGLSGQMAEITRDMGDIQLIYLVENQAKYRLRRTQPHGGGLVTLTYYVYFIQDDAGFWSIEGF